jgi:hypothetical protein
VSVKRKRRLVVADGRVCDACSACCRLWEIPELDKPYDSPCQHQSKTGCRIYSDGRPATCVDYKCLWLAGTMPWWARPDKGVLVDIHHDNVWPGTIVVVRIHETFAGGAKALLRGERMSEFVFAVNRTVERLEAGGIGLGAITYRPFGSANRAVVNATESALRALAARNGSDWKMLALRMHGIRVAVQDSESISGGRAFGAVAVGVGDDHVMSQMASSQGPEDDSYTCDEVKQ